MKRRPGTKPKPDGVTTGTCSACGRNIGVYVPRGGDGSQSLIRSHVAYQDGIGIKKCPGSKRPCRENSNR